MLVSGKLRPSDASAKKNDAGIGGGKGGVIADISLSSFSSFGKKQLSAFSAEPSGGKPAAAKQAATFNGLVAEALASNKAAPEKLSPDVEAAARRIGRGAGDRIIAFGKTQGWFGGDAEASTEAAPGIDESRPGHRRRRARRPPNPRPGPRQSRNRGRSRGRRESRPMTRRRNPTTPRRRIERIVLLARYVEDLRRYRR